LFQRNDKTDYYEQVTPYNDLKEIDLYQIKRGPNDIKYNSRTKNNENNKKDYREDSRKGIYFRCK